MRLAGVLSAMALLASGAAHAGEENDAPLEECIHVLQSDDALTMKGIAVWRLVGGFLEKQTDDEWAPDEAHPDTLCFVERFEQGPHTVTVTYAGFEIGVQTLVYRIAVETEGEPPREFLALHTGILNWLSGTHFAFTLSERHGEMLDVYAAYHAEPPYPQIRASIEAILAGELKPAISAEWAGGSELPAVTIHEAAPR